MTTAMEAGISDHIWTIAELCGLLPEMPSATKRIDKGLILKAPGEASELAKPLIHPIFVLPSSLIAIVPFRYLWNNPPSFDLMRKNEKPRRSTEDALPTQQNEESCL
jgi:hypothetical protein